jgi:hypothetical protein
MLMAQMELLTQAAVVVVAVLLPMVAMVVLELLFLDIQTPTL